MSLGEVDIPIGSIGIWTNLNLVLHSESKSSMICQINPCTLGLAPQVQCPNPSCSHPRCCHPKPITLEKWLHGTIWWTNMKQENSANKGKWDWLQRSCNIQISTPTQENFKTSYGHLCPNLQLPHLHVFVLHLPSFLHLVPTLGASQLSQILLCSVLLSDVRMLLTEPNFPVLGQLFQGNSATSDLCSGTRRHQKHHGRNQELIQNSCWNQVQMDFNCYRVRDHHTRSYKTAPQCADAFSCSSYCIFYHKNHSTSTMEAESICGPVMHRSSLNSLHASSKLMIFTAGQRSASGRSFTVLNSMSFASGSDEGQSVNTNVWMMICK